MENSKSGWTFETLKEYFEKILDGDRRSNEQRFISQEKAIETADHSRDVAIKKAEDSIEKKSDAVYVKLTDLQKALTEVMLRPEIEARLSSLSEKIETINKVQDQSSGKGAGLNQGWAILVGVLGLVGILIGIIGGIIALTK